MSNTFRKRQREMKRLEKQREKAERRVQKKLIKRAEKEVLGNAATKPAKSEPQG